MHMADALISGTVGGVMIAASVGTAGYSINKLKTSLDEKKVPLMAVSGAFIFATQMINFTIPGTGSSGHLGGALLLSILLGPQAAFLAMIGILLIQALFFADGGLLALGCNIFNMGFYACFITYPFIYKKIVGNKPSTKKIWIGAILASIIGLQLGAFSVVLETLLSGKSQLTFATFTALMQGIHLPIGIVEGIITAAVVSFIYKYKEDLIYEKATTTSKLSMKAFISIALVTVIVIAGGVSLIASSNPDGLEWSIGKIVNGSELEGSSSIHNNLESIQNKTAFLPDYNFKSGEKTLGTTVSGLVGSAIVIIIAFSLGTIILKVRKKSSEDR